MKRNGSTLLSGALFAGLLITMLAAHPASLDAQRAVRRGGDGGGEASSGGGQTDRGGSAGPRGGAERRAAPPARDAAPPQSAAPRGNTTAATAEADEGSRTASGTASERRRGDTPRTGVAVARRTPPSSGGRPIVVPDGWYPWGWGGYGFAGYYGFYDPWSYGGYGYQGRSYSRRDDGSVRLKVKPRDASVYVDGYYAGRVDDFDGIFQSLPLEPGPHRIEVQLDGFAPLTFDVRVLPERKITFEGELEPIAP